jgi:hypothetical protein
LVRKELLQRTQAIDEFRQCGKFDVSIVVIRIQLSTF